MRFLSLFALIGLMMIVSTAADMSTLDNESYLAEVDFDFELAELEEILAEDNSADDEEEENLLAEVEAESERRNKTRSNTDYNSKTVDKRTRAKRVAKIANKKNNNTRN